MRYLLALGSSPAAVQLADELQSTLTAAGHQQAGPPVLVSHQLAEAAHAAQPEVVVVGRGLEGDIPVGEAVTELRDALPRARILLLLGALDDDARGLARQVADDAGVFNLLPGTVRPQDVLTALVGPNRTYRDVRGLIESANEPRAETTEAGTVIAVLGAAPGVGAATVAANLCFLLAGAGHAVEVLDLRDYPRLAMLLHADRPPGGGRRQVGLRDVGVTALEPDEDAAALIAATARRVAWTLCLPPPDPLDPRTAAALVAAQAVWLVVTPEPWTLQTAATWLREGRVREPQVILNRHVHGFDVDPAFVQARLGRPCAAVLPEDPTTHWRAQRRNTVGAELDRRPWSALPPLLPGLRQGGAGGPVACAVARVLGAAVHRRLGSHSAPGGHGAS